MEFERRAFGLALVCLVAAGCGSRHELLEPSDADGDGGGDADADADTDTDADTDADVDADVDVDADTDADGAVEACGPYWTLRVVDGPRYTFFFVEAQHDEQTLEVVAEAVLPDGCWEPGPLVAETREADRRVVLTLLAWHHENEGCDEVEVPVRRVAALTLAAGTWTFEDGSAGTLATVPVSACSPATANCGCPDPIFPVDTPGYPCTADCECALPLRCMPSGVLDTGYRECRAPCAEDLDCGGGICGRAGEGGVFTACGVRTTDGCSEGSACAPGFECRVIEGFRACQPVARLSGTTRHECLCDEDCEEPGLDCVFSDGAGPGRCEARCGTTDGAYCGPGHTCGAGRVMGTPYDGVCEWVGD